MWGGAPYIPAGWRVTGKKSEIEAAAETGVKDAILDCVSSEDWNAGFAAAEAAGMRYIVSVADKAPRAPAFIISPSAFRIQDVPRTAEYKIPIPEGGSVYYILLADPGFEIVRKGWIDVVGGVATISVSERISGKGFVLLLYPRVKSSELPDYWERFDARRDSILGKLKSAPLGEGLRGILNPFGTATMWTPADATFVPDSTGFRLEFEAFLKNKYKDIVSLERAWRLLSPHLKDFKTAARLVPLFSRTKGLDYLFDPLNGNFVPADRATSGYWFDASSVIENAAARRMSRFAKAIKQVADVPVIYDWRGWSPVYDAAEPSGDGLGMRITGGTFDAIENSAAKAAATAIAWASKNWLIVTELSADKGQGFKDENDFRAAITDAAELGAKGWFVKWTGGAEAAWLKSIEAEAVADASFAARGTRAVFYPENARNPAVTMRLPGGIWWLPSPVAGERLDVGPDYEAYRHASSFANFTAIWRLEGPAKVKLRFAEPSRVRITRYDGAPIETKLLRDGIELVLDNMPALVTGTDEIPVPQDTIETARADYESLKREAKRQAVEIGEYRFPFEDSLRTLERNPGAAYKAMAAALRGLQLKLAPYVWLEGESASPTNFGEVIKSYAISDEKALQLSTRIKPPTTGYTAVYSIKTRTQEEHDVWIAARIPEEVRPHVSIDIAGKTFELRDRPQSGYGEGYAWYNLGRLPLRSGSYNMTVRVAAGAPKYEMSIDAVLITPLQFRPMGPRIPRFVPGS